MQMKRIITMLLAAALVLALGGCAGDSQGAAEETESPLAGGHSQTGTEEKKVTIEQTVIYDEKGVKVTATGLEEGFLGPQIHVLVENNSDQNIAFSGGLFVINGITVEGSVYAEAAAGKKANDTIDFMNSTLETAGIQALGVVSGVDTNIVDTDSFETLAKAPFRLETSLGEGHGQAVEESGEEIFREAGVSVTAKTMKEDALGQSIVLLVKNESGRDIILEAEHVSVNGFTVDAWMYDTVVKDTVRFCTLDILATSLTENGIDGVEDVTFTLSVIDGSSYEEIARSEELELRPAG